MYGSQWGSLAAPYFLLQVTRESVSVLQVTCTVSERAMKSKVRMINHYHHSTKLTGKNITRLLPLALLLVLHTRNNTNGQTNSGIALYYGDIYIASQNHAGVPNVYTV